MKLVLLIVKLLQDVLLSFNASCNLLIESTLLHLEICSSRIKVLITLDDSIADFFMDTVFDSVHPFFCIAELIPVVLLHLPDLFFKVLFEKSKLIFKLRGESLQRVSYSFNFRVCEVFVSLDLASDVLELGLKLLL